MRAVAGGDVTKLGSYADYRCHSIKTLDGRLHSRGGRAKLCGMGSLIKKRRKKMSKHKYRKRLRANRHKRKNKK